MPVGWEHPGGGASVEDLDTLEAATGAALPDDYRDFMLRHAGGVPQTNILSTADGDDIGITTILGHEDVEETRRLLGERVPSNMIPVANAAGGNLIFLSLPAGNVYWWDHELEDSEPFRLIASNFTEFWDALRPFDVSSVKPRPGQVLGGWTDPDLLREYGIDKDDS
jgi:hypothetical protein